MAQKKHRNLSAEAAAMFQMTSMSSEQVSAIGGGEKLNDLMDDIVSAENEKEIEKAHEEELAEAKSLGVEDSIIVESTPTEISKDFEQKLEEAQARYLEAVDDKKKAETEKAKLNKELISLSSQIDLLKTNTSREIANYKVEMADLNEAIDIYKANEVNYKAEIASLKNDLHELEIALGEANKIINGAGKPAVSVRSNNPANVVPMFTTKRKVPVKKPVPNNGYVGWN